ncbi:hypothetical protein ABXS69_01790 [Actinomyces timonensis]|uniref:Uncharacterized protein n=1 Tax=Actinomyces timonensis TaxID=1288391 RepID=A0AAU8N2T3_9ACTO
MLPVGLVDSRHLLVLADDVVVEEVEALALSLDERAGWVGASRLQLLPGRRAPRPVGPRRRYAPDAGPA